MAINQLRIALSVVHELSQGNKPRAEDFGISDKDFGALLMDLQKNKHYIEYASVRYYDGGEVVYITLDNARVTLEGEQFLIDNSALMKTYKSLKEVRDWIAAFIP